MKYDPKKHHRHSIRMKGYDYTQPGVYFVTICTDNRECLFDDPVLRRVVETYWRAIPRHATHVALDAWVVMPNHLHGIVVIEDYAATVGARHSSPIARLTNEPPSPATDAKMERPRGNALPLPGSLGAIVGNFKSITTRRINRIRHTPGMEVWQRNYYEHVIRNERALERIRGYIISNPLSWDSDIENPANSQGGRRMDAASYYDAIWKE